jgi:hypothetical protein
MSARADGAVGTQRRAQLRLAHGGAALRRVAQHAVPQLEARAAAVAERARRGVAQLDRLPREAIASHSVAYLVGRGRGRGACEPRRRLDGTLCHARQALGAHGMPVRGEAAPPGRTRRAARRTPTRGRPGWPSRCRRPRRRQVPRGGSRRPNPAAKDGPVQPTLSPHAQPTPSARARSAHLPAVEGDPCHRRPEQRLRRVALDQPLRRYCEAAAHLTPHIAPSHRAPSHRIAMARAAPLACRWGGSGGCCPRGRRCPPPPPSPPPAAPAPRAARGGSPSGSPCRDPATTRLAQKERVSATPAPAGARPSLRATPGPCSAPGTRSAAAARNSTRLRKEARSHLQRRRAEGEGIAP